MKKTIVMFLAFVLVICVAVGGTIAYLSDRTDEVTNTFTIGNIDITLLETTGGQYKMIPGNAITKDPKVTVVGGSETCWLFVEIEGSNNLNDFITYTIADGWTVLQGVPGVYYREVGASEQDQEFGVLANDQVIVRNDITKDMMDEIAADPALSPTLTFTAYAIQRDNIADAVTAWTELNTNQNP